MLTKDERIEQFTRRKGTRHKQHADRPERIDYRTFVVKRQRAETREAQREIRSI